jgi:hypothetical protein
MGPASLLGLEMIFFYLLLYFQASQTSFLVGKGNST